MNKSLLLNAKGIIKMMIAKSLKSQGVAVDIIVKTTGLSKEEIEKL